MPGINDIANKRFSKSMSGYRTEEVDGFLAEVAAEFDRRETEKKELERKLEILADKLEDYRRDEDSLRNALLGAQKLGDSVIRESKTKAEILMRDATIKSERMVKNAEEQIELSKQNLYKMQKEVAAFKHRLLSIYKGHLELISGLPEDDREEDRTSSASQSSQEDLPADNLTPENIASQIAASVESDSADFEETPVPVIMQEEEPEDIESDASPEEISQADQKASRFGPLKFGEGFALSHNKDKKETK